MIGVFSSGMRAIPNLESLLEDEVCFNPGAPKGLTAIAGWGHKATAVKARRMAQQWSKPYLAVEDGFLRSLGLGITGSPPLSLLVDDLGVYYDATRPSRLETMIGGECPPEVLALARPALDAVRSERLSKYNHAPDLEPRMLPATGRPRVLLVDQTWNDASVSLGGADAKSFDKMAEAARRDHPDADLFVKVHPDVTAGKKRGYLAESCPEKAMVIDWDVNPLSLLEQMDCVYTVTSQLGFEALIAGKPVHCFGAPFYAGWGLTDDTVRLDRRGAKRSLEEIFAAAYIRYARYVDPYSGVRCSIMDTIDVLVDLKRHERRNRGPLICAGFSWWRKGFAPQLFGSETGKVAFARTGKAAVQLAKSRKGRIVVWAAKTPPDVLAEATEREVPVAFVEDGFLRSSGLGSDFYYPYSLCMDSQGPYYDPNIPTDLEHLLASTDFDDRLLQRACALQKAIVENGVTKYNVGSRSRMPEIDSGGRKVVLVVGQVEKDKSVVHGGMGIYSDRELLCEVRSARPEAYVIYKPHPDVVSGNRSGGALLAEDRELYDYREDKVSLSVFFDVIDELHTLTSLSGFEALMRGVPVFTYGGPFYAGWGLTSDKHSFSRRQKVLSLPELVAGVLVLYPSYFDWTSGMFCGPEVVLKRLAAGEKVAQGKSRRFCSVILQKLFGRFINRSK